MGKRSKRHVRLPQQKSKHPEMFHKGACNLGCFAFIVFKKEEDTHVSDRRGWGALGGQVHFPETVPFNKFMFDVGPTVNKEGLCLTMAR